MSAYYNEIDPHAAAWLRELAAAGHIAPGEVDTRSIEDVQPEDLRGFVQCHFFAGIGGWSHALRLAGWPDDRPVWTGSCPCQPFSTAGQGAGFHDQRHLWPCLHWLIQERRPAVVAGEQVASKHADAWLDLVQDDLEALGYAFGAVAFPAAGVGAPHIRERTYWVAHGDGPGRGARRRGRTPMGHRPPAEPDRGAGRVDDADRARLEGRRGRPAAEEQRDAAAGPVGAAEQSGGVADGDGQRPLRRRQLEAGHEEDLRAEAAEWQRHPVGAQGLGATGDAGPTNGHWRDADWLLCRDGRWRPVEPGTFPLAHGIPARVGRLRGYGNAVNARQAALFMRIAMEWLR